MEKNSINKISQARYLRKIIETDALAHHKMAFISGPRQVGKTTLAKSFLRQEENYFSWDYIEFRQLWSADPHKLAEKVPSGLIVLDELHKHRYWKRSLKGLFDTFGDRLSIIVTGSARLDLYRRGGDSMVGRYFPYRLYPFSVSESATPPGPDELEVRPVNYPLKDLIKLSGFPEPLMGGAKDRAERWSRLRLERIMMQDVRDLRAIHQFKQMELMIDLLPTRIGSPFSLNAVREDLEIAYATGREWFEVLNNLYIIFSIPPYSKNIARSLKREPKIYLFDPLTITDPGAALENTIALHLLKACHFWTDTAQGFFQLHYLRNKEKQEVDFCITRDKKVWMLVECKSSDTQISPALQKFTELLKPHWSIQTVEKKNYDHLNSTSGIRVMDTERFLSMLV